MQQLLSQHKHLVPSIPLRLLESSQSSQGAKLPHVESKWELVLPRTSGPLEIHVRVGNAQPVC